jgi:predicted nucleic acid-binding protein
MSAGKVFVDTNILVYAHDVESGRRQETARRKLETLWDAEEPPAVSVQVLQELYVTLLRKGVPQTEARDAVEDHMRWHVVENTKALLAEGIRLHQQQQLSFWDALILAAARDARAAELWSEDFTAGREYDGVKIVNPLAG